MHRQRHLKKANNINSKSLSTVKNIFVNIFSQISFKKISLSSGVSHKRNLKTEIKGHIAITSKTKSSPGLGCVNAILRFSS